MASLMTRPVSEVRQFDIQINGYGSLFAAHKSLRCAALMQKAPREHIQTYCLKAKWVILIGPD
jgi:hypothetical protein